LSTAWAFLWSIIGNLLKWNNISIWLVNNPIIILCWISSAIYCVTLTSIVNLAETRVLSSVAITVSARLTILVNVTQ
jgi:hypothetical protein